MSTLIKDARHAVRTLVKTPGFTAAALVALALGIGANTAIFTIVNAVLLRPLPYPGADRLLLIERKFERGFSPTVSVPKFDYWQKHNRVFESVTAFDVLGAGYNLAAEGEAERIKGMRASADFNKVLGIQPMIGRGFVREDDVPGAPRVVLLSHGLWQRRFGGDRGILGKTLALSGEPYTVIGVMPPAFRTYPESELWTTLQLAADYTDKANYLFCLGRLKPGATEQQAAAEMESLGQQFKREYPDLMNTKESVRVERYHSLLVGEVRPALLILLGAVACVLLIACANVANLLLARAAGRHREVAIRMSLGAGPWRLMQQFLTESLLLALAGGAAGLVLGYWGVRALEAVSPTQLPLVDIAMDTRVLLFALGVSILTGVLFGLAPALHASRPNLTETLKEGSRSATAGARRSRTRNALVVAEIALAAVLVIGAGLLIQTFAKLRGVQPGFDPSNVLTMQMSLTGEKYQKTAHVDSFSRLAVQRIEALPGVLAAASVTSVPLQLGPDVPFDIEGRPEMRTNPGSAQWRAITPNYFRVMRIPLVRGRPFTDNDSAGSPPAIIVNETFVRRWLPKENPLGRQVTIGRVMGPQMMDAPRQIVGVVGDVRSEGLDNDVPVTMFVPVSQVRDELTAMLNKLLPTSWVVRTAAAPLGMESVIRREIRAADPQQPVANVRSMDQIVAESIGRQNFNMILLGAFAVIALLLAAVGIYGLISYSVTQRTHEIGIRMALGAGRRDMLRLVVGQGMALAAIGIVVGLAGAFGLTRLMRRILFQVEPTDALTFSGVSAILAAVALAASYLPARRATRVDPIIALRNE